MKYLALALLAILFTGCAPEPAKPAYHEWVADYLPTTSEEQKLCDTMIQKILTSTQPVPASGQAIEQAKIAAFQTYCRPTLWEYDVEYYTIYNVTNKRYGNKTGRWKYADSKPTQ